MKTRTKIFAALLALALIFGTGLVGAAAEGGNNVLQFRADGTFRILFITDCHQKGDVQPEMIAFMRESIAYTKPDVVIFGGDNVWDSACENEQTVRLGITRLLAPVVEAGLPFAFVFGNHDEEYHPGGVDGRAALMSIYRETPGCLTRDELGNGKSTFSVPILSGGKTAVNLWFFDSNQGAVDAAQIEWYKARSSALAAANGGKPVPAMAFQHIPVPQVYECFTPSPFALPGVTYASRGKNYHWLLPKFSKLSGVVMEPPDPPDDGAPVFEAWAAQGDVFAAVFGHDHVSSYTAKVRGIDIVQCPGSTFGASYGANACRGATLFTLREDQPGRYTKQDITYRQLGKLPGSEIKCARRSDGAWYWLLYLPQRAVSGVVDLFR